MSAIDTTECPVCYTEENVGKLGCGHPICGGCKAHMEGMPSVKQHHIATSTQCPHGQNPSHIIKLIMCPMCRQIDKLSYGQLEMENLYFKRTIAIMQQQANRTRVVQVQGQSQPSRLHPQARGSGYNPPQLPPAVLIYPAPAPVPAPRLGPPAPVRVPAPAPVPATAPAVRRRVRCSHPDCESPAPTQRICTGMFCTEQHRQTPCCRRCDLCSICKYIPYDD